MSISRSTRRSITAGLAVLIVLELSARLLAPHLPGRLVWDTEFSQTKAQQIETIGEVDVVMLGSSIVNAGLDGPTIVAQTPWADSSYNTGLPSTTPRTWAAWADDVVFSDLCPDVLVIGVSVRDLNDNNSGAVGRLQAYSSSAGRQKLYGVNLQSLEERVGEWSAFVRIRSRLREPGNVLQYFRTGRVPSWPDPNLSEEGRFLGFDAGHYQQDEERDEALRTGALADFAMGGSELDAVRSIVEQGLALGETVVLVEMPSMRTDLAALLPDGAIGEAGLLLADLGAELGVPVWRFPDIDDQPQFFADLYHPTSLGTDTLSTQIGRRLAETFPAGVETASCRARTTAG